MVFFYVKVALRASSLLHNRLFIKIVDSPMRFFDSTPVGRILNLFSRDLDESMLSFFKLQRCKINALLNF